MTDSIFEKIRENQHQKQFQELHWEGKFEDYLKVVRENPAVTRTAFQRLFDMVRFYGTRTYTKNNEKIIHYNFFDDPTHQGRDAVFGLDQPLMKLMNLFKAAAEGYGIEKRIILLHGPVGSAKSTIVRLLKQGLEAYSRSDAGKLFSFSWRVNSGEGIEFHNCPMNEDPLHLIPKQYRERVLNDLLQGSPLKNRINIEGELCPFCRQMYKELNQKYRGDWTHLVNEVKIRRVLLSETDRVGIGTFQPKDEKNQDATELTGDINYRKIAIYGSDSDPRAFNFDGEFNIANRGIIEFVEVLKLEVAFLYDLLGASQEHKIKPKKFAQTDIDEVIIGHTNEPEYRKLQNNEYMEALRDRTVKVDIPYNCKLRDEIKIYERDYNTQTISGIHIAPHTIEIAAMWAVLTRLEPPKNVNLTLMQKLKLYDGKVLSGFSENHVRELQAEAHREGMTGISPRYVQDKISNALVSHHCEGCVNPFIVLNELESGLKHASLVTNEELQHRYRELISIVKEEYEDMLKKEVQRAIAADEEALNRLCANYIDNIKAYTRREQVHTGQSRHPNERLMRAIEEKIDIPESRKDDFRREVMNYIGALALEQRSFNFRSNERLQRALELKLFEEQKDSILLSSMVSSVLDDETEQKIQIVKKRMIDSFGYCEVCATDVLNYVSNIFARGDVRQNEDTNPGA